VANRLGTIDPSTRNRQRNSGRALDRTFLGNVERVRLQCGARILAVDVPRRDNVPAGSTLNVTWGYDTGTIVPDG
jgi:hypothetical protein